MKIKAICALLAAALVLCLSASAETADYSVYANTVLDTAQLAAKYFVGLADSTRLLGKCTQGSEAYSLIYEFSKWHSVAAARGRFENLEVSDYATEGDGRFSCRVTGDFVCSYYTRDDAPFALDYKLYFELEREKIKLYDISLLPKDAERIRTDIETDEDGITLYLLRRKTYKAYVMTVEDPSRLYVGVTNVNFSGVGKKLERLIEQYGAIGGINGCGFEDPNGKGNGGNPLGLVIADGQLLRRANPMYAVVGFDADNVLRTGYMTSDEAVALGLRDAVSWGPPLIIDGKAQPITRDPTGLNPRSVIGQAADGSIMLVTVEGRRPDSPGASYEDLVSLMADLGAVTACNLDGGPSSAMYLNGKLINGVEPLTAKRGIPCAILIKGR
ncbi:MAG: phosphodiester glycosidase family protein [Clostridia bacterium]|nr:phosphodiester glycosidase family protein [Clostridia bacterium]